MRRRAMRYYTTILLLVIMASWTFPTMVFADNCNHPYLVGNYAETDYVPIEGNANEHTVLYTFSSNDSELKCAVCGVHVYNGEDVIQSKTEDHAYNSLGICSKCQYECQHIDSLIEKVYDVSYRLNNNDVSTHKKTINYEQYCLNCGKAAHNWSDGIETVIEPHEYGTDSICIQCGYTLVDGCSHSFSGSTCQTCGYRCEHNYEYKHSSCIDCIHMTDSFTAATHTINHKWFNYCTICGKKGSPFVEYRLVTEVHQFSEHGACVECGYSNSVCQHLQWKEDSISFRVEYEIGDDTTHKQRTILSGYCDNCGTNLEEISEWLDEFHSYENGKCMLCGFTEEVCTHENCTDAYDDSGNRPVIFSNKTATHHDYANPYICTCNDCGRIEEIYGTPVTVEHAYTDGVCVCGAQKDVATPTPTATPTAAPTAPPTVTPTPAVTPEPECDHENCIDTYDDSGNRPTKFTNITETHHSFEAPYICTCNNCGRVEEIYAAPITIEHSYNDEGLCVCGQTIQEPDVCTNHDFQWSTCKKCGFTAYIILSKDSVKVGDTITLSTNLPKGDYTFSVGKRLSLSGNKATAVAAGKGNVYLYYKGGSNSVASCVVDIECEEHTAMTKRTEVEYHDDGNTHTVITTTYGVCTCGFEGVIERTYESVEHEDENFNGECDRCGGAVKQYFFDVPAYQKTKGAFVKYGGKEYPISFPSFDTSTYSNYDLTYGGWVTVYEDSYRVDSYDFAGLISGLDLDSQVEPNAGGASIPQPGKMGTAGYNTDSASFGNGNSSINVASGLISAGYQAVDNWNVELFKVVLQEKEDDPSQRRTVLMLGNTDVPRQGYVESTKILSSMCYGNFAFYGNLPEGISITDSAAIADWIIRKSGVPLPTGASSDNTDYQYDLIVSPSVDWYEKQESYNKYISFDEDGNAFIIERIMENDTYALVGYYMNSLADETYLRNFMAPDVYTNMKDYMLMPTPVDVSEFLTKIEDDGKLEINY